MVSYSLILLVGTWQASLGWRTEGMNNDDSRDVT